MTTSKLISTNDLLSGIFSGELVKSSDNEIHFADVVIHKLNETLVKVNFTILDRNISFRAMFNENQEGQLILIQNKLTPDNQLKGVSGFIKKYPNYHGGFIKRLNSFFFHIEMNNYSGMPEQFYFFGQKEN